MNPKIVDMTGKTCGRLLVEERAGTRPNGQATWRCRCVCGSTVVVPGSDLRRGNTMSCGCLGVESRRAVPLKHGGRGTTEYRIWTDMLQRCTNPKREAFKDYGGRGIGVCERWILSFESFREDMGPRPKGTTLDRVDNDKGYEPGNCRWAPWTQQARNRRTNRFVEAYGQRLTLAEWAERTGLRAHTIRKRIELGWTGERAVTVRS